MFQRQGNDETVDPSTTTPPPPPPQTTTIIPWEECSVWHVVQGWGSGCHGWGLLEFQV